MITSDHLIVDTFFHFSFKSFELSGEGYDISKKLLEFFLHEKGKFSATFFEMDKRDKVVSI